MLKKVIITIIVLIILIPTCIGVYLHYTKEETEEITTELKGTFKNTQVRVDASLATQPLMDALIEYFGDTDLLNDVKENYTNTHPGYVKLINNETDLLIVTEPSEEELALALSSGVELEITKIVNEGFVFFTNVNNPVDNLTLDQIISIYSGEITNWKIVGGNDAEIIAYQRPTNSGSQTGMLSLVMKNTPIKTPTTAEMIETMGGIIDIVADYENGQNSIGYSYYYYANIMYSSPDIKFLGINGVKPTYDTIANEEYPLMTAYYLVTRSDADSNTLKLKEAFLSNEGKNVAKEAGYVSIK